MIARDDPLSGEVGRAHAFPLIHRAIVTRLLISADNAVEISPRALNITAVRIVHTHVHTRQIEFNDALSIFVASTGAKRSNDVTAARDFFRMITT